MRKPASQFRRNWAKLWRNKAAVFGGFILLGYIFTALFAPLLFSGNPAAPNLIMSLEGPSAQHLLGTDDAGKDVLSGFIYGSRVSLLIGISVMLIAGLIGTTLGLLAGYFGGRMDMFVSFLVTVRLALPAVLVAVAVVSLIGGSMRVVVLVLGFLVWDRFAVVVRASTQQIRPLEYVAAAKSAGCSTLRILAQEILPNLMNNLIVVATLEVARAILLEAALSFLGMGVQPPTPSWGLMISEGKEFMLFYPYLVTIPGVALFILLLGFNLFGDGIRDVTAPEGR